MLGAAFGVVRGVVLLLAVAVVVNMSPLRDARTGGSESQGRRVCRWRSCKSLKPALPERFGQYLP